MQRGGVAGIEKVLPPEEGVHAECELVFSVSCYCLVCGFFFFFMLW